MNSIIVSSLIFETIGPTNIVLLFSDGNSSNLTPKWIVAIEKKT